MRIYHNPRCRKSREALEIMRKAGVEPEIIEYLKNPPTKKALVEILQMLDMRPEDIIRKNEQVYKDNFRGKELSDDEWLDVLTTHPKLLERPIVIKDQKAVLGRPPERVKSLL